MPAEAAPEEARKRASNGVGRTAAIAVLKVAGYCLGGIHIAALYAAMFINCNVVALVSLLFVNPILPNVHHRMLAELAAYAWRAFTFWAQVVGGLTPVWTGDVDKLLKEYKGSKLVMANHQSFSDSFLIYSIGWPAGEVAHIRAFAKKSLSYSPVVGWAWSMLNFIFLSRSFEKDKPNIQRQMQKLADRSKAAYSTGNYWMTIFPEGTRCRPDKLKDAQEFSKARSLPVFENTLVPRSKGLLAAMGEDCTVLRETADAVVDLTIGYLDRRSGGLKVRPSVTDLLFGLGRRWKVHVHVRVIPIKEVPKEDDKFTKWLMDVFVEKDKLLNHHKKHGCFPGPVRKVPTATLFLLVYNLITFLTIALFVVALGLKLCLFVQGGARLTFFGTCWLCACACVKVSW